MKLFLPSGGVDGMAGAREAEGRQGGGRVSGVTNGVYVRGEGAGAGGVK